MTTCRIEPRRAAPPPVELRQVESPDEHHCETPEVQAVRLFDPLRGTWSSATLFLCCQLAYCEPPADEHGDEAALPGFAPSLVGSDGPDVHQGWAAA